jgi:hypothetical protein
MFLSAPLFGQTIACFARRATQLTVSRLISGVEDKMPQISLREKSALPNDPMRLGTRSQSSQKISLPFFVITDYIDPVSRSPKRRFAVVTKRGAGCDGRIDIAGERFRCVRPSRVVLIPRRWDQGH